MTRLGGEFIPSLPEGDFAVDTRVLPGSNLKTSTDAVQKSSQILKKFPEIEKNCRENRKLRNPNRSYAN